MEAKTAEVFKAALLCFVAQSHLTLCDPWTGARLPPLQQFDEPGLFMSFREEETKAQGS